MNTVFLILALAGLLASLLATGWAAWKTFCMLRNHKETQRWVWVVSCVESPYGHDDGAMSVFASRLDAQEFAYTCSEANENNVYEVWSFRVQ